MANRFTDWLYGRTTPVSPVEEAAQQRIGKDAKIQTGLEAVLLNSIQKIDQAERESVNEYRNRQFGAKPQAPHGSGSGTGEDGLIIADDIQTTNIYRKGLGPVATVVLAGSLAAAAYLLSQHNNQPPEVPPSTETDYRVESRIIEP